MTIRLGGRILFSASIGIASGGVKDVFRLIGSSVPCRQWESCPHKKPSKHD